MSAAAPVSAPNPAMAAARPEPPYFAVIFTSQRRDGDAEAYGAMAQAMAERAAAQPGYLGAESARDTQGLGITVSYWRTLEDIAAWRADLAHQAARDRGRTDWYAHYELRIARVERSYHWQQADGPADPMGTAA